MPLLNETVRGQLTDMLGTMPTAVDLLFYPGPDAEAADLMRSLLLELADTVPGLHLDETGDAPTLEPGHDTGLTIEGPVTSLRKADGTLVGARFLGIPGGMEFGTLVEAIRMTAHGEPDLTPETLEALEALQGPVHIQVFTTPT